MAFGIRSQQHVATRKNRITIKPQANIFSAFSGCSDMSVTSSIAFLKAVSVIVIAGMVNGCARRYFPTGRGVHGLKAQDSKGAALEAQGSIC
jgi:hypothetical protein